MGRELTADVTFPALALFNVLRFPLNQMGQVLSTVVQCKVAMARLDDFLCKVAKPQLSVQHILGPHEGSAVELEDATFSWGAPTITTASSDGKQAVGEEGLGGLANVTLSLQAGCSYALVGPVGSGKSTLVQSILGETALISGSASVRGSVAYVPQQAWILADTVRANIVFGLPFNETWSVSLLAASRSIAWQGGGST
jgi:ABC-type multidrug transport system fused ATPase/permease subunit